tara:strand:- start:763 stop:927 length:165 start_codon:yes stop_codon:yes gene_type:complete
MKILKHQQKNIEKLFPDDVLPKEYSIEEYELHWPDSLALSRKLQIDMVLTKELM